MGRKTPTKWFCACFGNHARVERRRSDGHDRFTSACHVDNNNNESDQNKHAIAVAIATAAVADAAVAAAQAAAAVVRLTSSSGRCGGSCSASAHVSVSDSCRVVGGREEWVVVVAAVKIQSAFRGYLAKRALLALKGLVKLQALARGHIVRKRTEDTWRCMQALLRAQSRVCAERALVSESPHSSTKSSQFQNLGPETPEKTEHIIQAKSTRHKRQSMLKRNVSKSKSNRTIPIDDEKSAKILEIDSHFTPNRRNLFHSFHLNHHHQTLPYDQNSYYSCTTSKDSTTCQTVPSQSSCCEVHSLGPFTPTKSDGLKSYYNPSYMAYTESSKAKSRRSLSAPKQRPKIERSRSVNRYLRSSERKVSALHANFAARDYPGSGQLNKFGVPMRVMN